MLGLTGACAGRQFDGVEYSDKEVSFRLGALPPGAHEVSSDDAKISLHNEAAGSTVAIGARCGKDGDEVPLRALVQHLFIQFTDRTLLHEEEKVLDGRAALEMEVEARLDGVARRFIVTVLKKNGCVYDFLHVDGGGDDPALVQSRANFRAMVSGFSTRE